MVQTMIEKFYFVNVLNYIIIILNHIPKIYFSHICFHNFHYSIGGDIFTVRGVFQVAKFILFTIDHCTIISNSTRYIFLRLSIIYLRNNRDTLIVLVSFFWFAHNFLADVRCVRLCKF